MPLARHVSRRFHLQSSTRTALMPAPKRGRASLCTPRRPFTCLASSRALPFSVRPDTQDNTRASRQADVPLSYEENARSVLECSAQVVLPSLCRSNAQACVPAYLASTECVHAATVQRTLYDMLKRTRIEGEAEADFRQTRVLADHMLTTILKETGWHSSCGVKTRTRTEEALRDAFAPLLRTASPAAVPRLIEALWVPRPFLPSRRQQDLFNDSEDQPQQLHLSAIEAFFSPPAVAALREQSCRWHPSVPLSLVKACLQSLAHAVRSKRAANQALSLSTLSDLHETVMRTVPFPQVSQTSEHERSSSMQGEVDARVSLRAELGVLAMTALKGAPCTLLCELYAYLEAEDLTTVALLNKFLASCGWTVSDVSRRGQQPLNETEMTLVLRAVQRLVEATGNSGDGTSASLEATQEGLIYCVPALLAAGRDADVVALYHRLPALRETPQSVMARVHVNDVPGAIEAVERLGQSRPEGWVALSPTVLQTLSAVARLLGRHGAAEEEISLFYAAVVSFHNASMIISQLVEDILAGLCDRIESLPRLLGSLRTVPPRQALELVLPTLRATLRYIGDELNADILFGLLESALQVAYMAVPLTTAVVWCLEKSEAVSVRCLFHRVDASTAGMPFLQYYALCYARDRGDRETHDHLASVWHVSGDTVWRRDGQLATPYKLWKCTACGRLNSDRFNYCLCSSLRYGFVLCAQCGHGQDERVFLCRCCGASLHEGNTYTAVSRKSWTCTSCDATNHARQTMACLRCQKLTGPVATAFAAMRRTATPNAPADDTLTRPAPPFCTCSGPEAGRMAAYATLTGCCVTCGRFATPHAVAHSTVWRCPGCHQLHSSLERACPHCPQVDYLPALVEGHASVLASTRRHCGACGARVENLFATVCTACDAAEDAFERPNATAPPPRAGADDGVTTTTPPSLHTSSPSTRLFSVCPQCLSLTPEVTEVVPSSSEVPSPSPSSDSRRHCGDCGAHLDSHGGPQTLASCERVCPQCRLSLSAVYTGAVCPRCATFVPPQTSTAWPSPTILSTVSTLLELVEQRPHHAHGRLASLPSATETVFEETCGQTVEASLGRHKALEETLLQLRSVWSSRPPPDCAPSPSAEAANASFLSLDGLPVAALEPIRVDVATRLSRFVAVLSPFVRTDSHARRVVALAKQLLEMFDRRCGVLSTHFSTDEVCHECLGNHPPELCPYEPLHASAAACWCCEACGLENSNTDVGRYLCQHCLVLRPLVQDMFVSECWQCVRCARANVAFETYCIYCGQSRPAQAVSSTVLEEGAAGAEQRNHIPFLPTRCQDCGLVYLEMRCPLCYPRNTYTATEADVKAGRDQTVCENITRTKSHRDSSAPEEASGIVCMVRPRYAFIQPFGTTKPDQRVHVGVNILDETPLTVGRAVRYIAEREATSGRLRAVALKPQKTNAY